MITIDPIYGEVTLNAVIDKEVNFNFNFTLLAIDGVGHAVSQLQTAYRW